jgi:outer membrane protein assembly factor BamB
MTTGLPGEVGPTTAVKWSTPLPPGHASPVIFGDRIYLQADRQGELLTIALDRQTGRILWERKSEYTELESIHPVGSYCQSSPAADADGVVVFFGSCGLVAYDRDGNETWRVRMGPFKNGFGAASSPVLVDDSVILCQDHDVGSFLARYNRKTGEEIWRVDRSEFPRNFATPVVWTVDGRRQIVCAATLRVAGYDFESGEELWTVRGVSRIVNTTALIGPDNTLYVCCWSPGADEDNRPTLPAFDVALAKGDANENGVLDSDEDAPDDVKRRFDQVDRNKNGQVERDEYDSMKFVFENSQNVFLAIRPGGSGEITDTHVLWKQTKLLPYCPSPVLVGDHVFTVKNGGIFASFDCRTGSIVKQGRVPGASDYYASPVSGDGKIYTVSQTGQLSVVQADGQWSVLSSAELEENVYATPAIADGCLYVRTAGRLYCFSSQREGAAAR